MKLRATGDGVFQARVARTLRQAALAIATTAALAGAFAAAACAAPADLDAAFGSGGVAVNSITVGNNELRAIAIQPDGKIVAVGKAIVGITRDFALMRLNVDGSLDDTFSGDGLLTLDVVGGRHDDVYDVAIQPDGKIVAVGSVGYGPGSGTMFAAVRLNPDGSYDNTFGSGNNGRAWTAFGVGSADHQVANAIVIQNDGKIVVGGYTDVGGNNDFALARLDVNGLLDTSFSGDGKLYHWLGSQGELIEDLAIQPDGKIVAVGSSAGVFTDYDFAIARYKTDGTLDSTFNDSGFRVTPSLSDADYGKGVAVQPDGKIVLAGYTSNGTQQNAVLLRFTADGAKDASFGSAGMVTTSLAPFSTSAREVALQNNGKIVVAGQYYMDSPPVQDFFVAQYDSNGSLDPSFDGDGVFTKALSPNGDLAEAIAVQSDGKIVAGGLVDSGVDYEFGLLRLQGELPYAAPPQPEPPDPVSTISSPSGGTVKSLKLRAFSGTAGPPGAVAKVEIALRRIDRKLLKRGRCLWLRNAKGGLVKTKSRRGKCETRRFLKASGTDKWSYRLKRRLAKGKYELYVRVTLTTGETQTDFSASAGNLKVFKVT